MRPPAWFTGDADVWCRDCAARWFGPNLDDAEDHEGNPVHPVFSWEESELTGYGCGGAALFECSRVVR